MLLPQYWLWLAWHNDNDIYWFVGALEGEIRGAGNGSEQHEIPYRA